MTQEGVWNCAVTKPLQLQNGRTWFKVFFCKSFHLKLFNEPDYSKICCFSEALKWAEVDFLE